MSASDRPQIYLVMERVDGTDGAFDQSRKLFQSGGCGLIEDAA